MTSSYVGRAGNPALYTPTGVGTVVAEGRPTETFEVRPYIRETWLKAGLSIIKAWKADSEGNLVFRKTARNFERLMATAGRVIVVEVEELVEDGTIGDDNVHTPGVFVDRIAVSGKYDKLIEHRTTRVAA